MDGYKEAESLLSKGIKVLCGGFPCQDISVAGMGGGIKAERSGLWRAYLRTIRIFRPEIAIVENVAALLGRGMGRVCGDLANFGYDAEWDCISAAQCGLPHLRERIWIIAYPNRIRLQGGQQRVQEDKEQGNINAPILPALPLRKARSKDDLPEPRVIGSNNGIPDRAHRIKSIGNSVTPGIPEFLGVAIMNRLNPLTPQAHGGE